MQDSNPTHEQRDEEEIDASERHPLRRRIAAFFSVVLVLVALALLPPLINVSRFQHRIASNIGRSLGRPVHLDRVSLTLLPVPGFTIENFVVDEDPAFGSEPVIRADSVHASLRVSSLWHRRFEFSTISLTDPSVNLVHTGNGKWNIESILIQAARIDAAPTAQAYVSAAPRFPYIEATGGRINLKLDQVKTPFSLTEATFALWLPEPNQWRLRLEARPARTDTNASGTGTLRVEGTLGRAATLAEVPISLHGELRDAQLGGASQLILGRDAGLRGILTLTADARGTIGRSAIEASLDLSKARRADFVPARLLAVQAHCQAVAQEVFHSFSAIECHWPPSESSDRAVLVLSGAVPDIRRPAASTMALTVPALPAADIMDWLRVVTQRPPEALLLTGTLAGTVAYIGQPRGPSRKWSGELELTGETLRLPAGGANSVPLADIVLHPATPEAAPIRKGRQRPKTVPPAGRVGGFVLAPIEIPLGGKEPASLEGHFDANGYTLHLTGNVLTERLLALGDAIPQFGDGLRELLQPTCVECGQGGDKPVSVELSSPRPEPSATDPVPVPVDLTATRPWGEAQVWQRNTPAPHKGR